MIEEKYKLSLSFEERRNFDELHQDIDSPKLAHIYVLFMDGSGRMPYEIFNILSNIEEDTIIANIINLRGEVLHIAVYKKFSTSIIYDTRKKSVEIISENWDDLHEDNLLSAYFNVLIKNKNYLVTTESSGLDRAWWFHEKTLNEQKRIQTYKEDTRNKELLARLLVATMDELDITHDDIERIRTAEDYRVLRHKYTNLIGELVKGII